MADTIFADGALEASTASLEKDLVELAQSRLLYQFQNSVVVRQLLVALVEEVQELHEAIIGLVKGYQLPNAVGAQLDVLGRIVGQDRILLNAELRQWFGPDGTDVTVGPPDEAPVWVQGAPLFGDLPADDAQYLDLIISKIFKNGVKGSTIPELLQFGKFLTGRDVSFRTVGPMELGLVVPDDMPYNQILNLLRVVDDKTADRRYLVPIAATVRLTFLEWRPVPPFGPDVEGWAPDVGKISLKTELL